MLNSVNTYLKRIPLWRSWIGRKYRRSSSQGLCSLRIGTNDAALIYTPHARGKIEVSLCKTLTFAKVSDFIMALTDTVKKNQLEGARCAWMLDPSHYQLMLVEDLPVEPVEFQAAIRWKIKNLIPYPVEDAVIDSFYIPIQKTFRSQKMIMVVVARESYLQSMAEQIQQCGLNLEIIDIQELALRNITAMFETDEISSALIYAQAKYVDLIITRHRKLYLSRRIEFDTSGLEASQTEQNIGLDKLALEIQRSFDYYQSQWRIPAPTRLFFASAKSTIINIAESLSNYLETSVKMLDLNDVIVNKAGLSVEQQNKLLPLLGSLLREEIIEHDTTD